jgi:hypothetical protein
MLCGHRAANFAKARELLAVPTLVVEPKPGDKDEAQLVQARPCPCCGGMSA